MTAGDGASDEELMAAWAGGEVAAFERLFERHRRGLFTFLVHAAGSRAAAEDLFQETFLRVVRARARYRPTGSFRGWLYAVACNALTDHRRRRGLRDAGAMQDETDEALEARAAAEGCGDGTLARVHAAELRARIEAALGRLPESQRDVFLLRERAGLDFEAIARLTGAGRGTVKSRMRYALAALRHLLAGSPEAVAELHHE